jgi:hypothetical protein
VWGTTEVHTGFWWGDLRKGDHFEDLGVDGRIILKCKFKKWDWIAVAEDRDRWWALLIAVVCLRVP